MANVPVITEPDWDGKTPYSRSEAILLSIINGTPIDTEKWEGIPLSRGEYLLLQLKDVIEDNSMLDFKGRVDSVNDLPSTGNKKGDVYSVGPESQLNRPEYFWTGTYWEYFGQIVDLSGYATLQEVTTAINAALNTVEQSYLKLTGGTMVQTGTTPDKDGRIKFNRNTTNVGYIGSDYYSNDLVLGVSNAPLRLTYNDDEVLRIPDHNTIIFHSFGNSSRFALENLKITATTDGSIEFVTKDGPFTKMDNTLSAKHWTAGIGSTTYIDLDAQGQVITTNKRLNADSGIDTGSINITYDDSGTNKPAGAITGAPNGININGAGVYIGANAVAISSSSVLYITGSNGVTVSGQTSFNSPVSLQQMVFVPNGSTSGSIGSLYVGDSYVAISVYPQDGLQINGPKLSVSVGTLTIGTGNATLNNNPLRATVLLTQAEYDALTTKDPNVVYNIYEPDEEEGE